VTTDLDRLWTLHGLDEEVAALDAELAKYPEQRRALANKVAAARARLDANQATAIALLKQRRDAEREIEAADALEKKFLGQQGAVKTNVEFQALTHEIAGARAKRSDIETRVLMIMDDEEKTSTARPVLERELAAAEAELADREQAIGAEEGVAQARRGALEARREANIAALEPASRQRYERAFQARGGRAVVPIVKGACGGCYRTLPPQALMEARKRDRLLTCDGCGRLLVLPPDAAA
jgi:predicted  nucleic acid-binding Zn-ribbon protein